MLTVRDGCPDFSDIPWDFPLLEWQNRCAYTEELPRGASRHPVVFVNFNGKIFSFKELPPGVAEREYEVLLNIESLRLPAVVPVGYAHTSLLTGKRSILITKYLDYSIPFRSLFMGNRFSRYQEHLLDALAGLVVQLHLADIFWGDCSLSNTLFRRDAGALRAYLVDAETAEIFPTGIPAYMRHQDLEILESNINGEIADLTANFSISKDIPLTNTGAYIRMRYQNIWEEITREIRVAPGEHFRIQERIRALNALGFSVGNIEFFETVNGDQLRLRIVVTDRNFHHDQLYNLTGIDAEEMQALKMMNEVQELKATLSQQNNRSTPLSVAAYHWQKNIYEPTIARLNIFVKSDLDAAEMYCQVLEHKWFLSEKAQRDVGHEAATQDYLENISSIHPR